MQKKIKFIWDFRGPASQKTAEHHEKHLQEFLEMEDLQPRITGLKVINEMHSTAYMVVLEEHMVALRDKLRPHRGELFTEEPT